MAADAVGLPPPRSVILTGERGTGKTTLCLALAALSSRYTGLASPGIVGPSGNRIGIASKCLATGEEWVLARSDRDLEGPRFGRFSFSSAGIVRAVECLRGILLGSRDAGAGGRGAAHGLRAGVTQPVIIIDEIGPLELELDGGLAPVLPLLAEAGHLLLVVRSSLAERVEALVPRHRRELLALTPENRSPLVAVVAGLFA